MQCVSNDRCGVESVRVCVVVTAKEVEEEEEAIKFHLNSSRE